MRYLSNCFSWLTRWAIYSCNYSFSDNQNILKINILTIICSVTHCFIDYTFQLNFLCKQFLSLCNNIFTPWVQYDCWRLAGSKLKRRWLPWVYFYRFFFYSWDFYWLLHNYIKPPMWTHLLHFKVIPFWGKNPASVPWKEDRRTNSENIDWRMSEFLFKDTIFL